MINLSAFEIWFITGSQHLYGEETLIQVKENAETIAAYLDKAGQLSVRIVMKPVVKTPEEIYAVCIEANNASNCIGVITWMHTFSPAKMWIRGLKALKRPIAHLHTQFNRDIPWSSIDMHFMNLNQSAHGDREFGYMMTRMRINRKVIAGHWQDPEVLQELNVWSRAAAAWNDWQGAKFVRFGDNMRYVAVTEGDKVEAELKFGFSVNTYGIGDLVQIIQSIDDHTIHQLVESYFDKYTVSETMHKGQPGYQSLVDAAKIEAGLRRFLQDGQYKGFTDTFEDLHGMIQLPGIAAQRLMAEGYGFAGEGDWKTAALVRAMKVMGSGLPGGNSFMEDYTYHLDPENTLVLGAHMLEICESISAHKPFCQVHPLNIGGKADPVRLIFDAAPGAAINVSMIDMGNRFRLLVNEVNAVSPPHELPHLPVARVLWKPLPDFRTATTAWILAGGGHHTGYSQNLSAKYVEDFAEMAGIEYLLIGKKTELTDFKNTLRWNDTAFK